jgi:hypothetical protein
VPHAIDFFTLQRNFGTFVKWNKPLKIK